jgi:prolyl-tRNA synthetase
LYQTMSEAWADVCLDDRDLGPWAKFADAELIWYPTQIIIGNKTLDQNMSCEVVKRASGEKELVKITDVTSVV